jgi:hypothetical protein
MSTSGEEVGVLARLQLLVEEVVEVAVMLEHLLL